LIPWRRGPTLARALRSHLHVKRLEHRTLLTGGLKVVPSPTIPGSQLLGTAAIAASDLWAVGDIVSSSGSSTTTLAEHFDGTSWKIVSSPNPGAGGNELFGAAALSSGTVVAVGESFNSSGVSNGLILSNSGKTPQPAATTAGTASAARTRMMSAPLEAAVVDQLFTANVASVSPLSSAGRRAPARQAADNGARALFPWDVAL
jgi:hypothetical protein